MKAIAQILPTLTIAAKNLATEMTNIKLGSTFSNDPLPDKRFDFQFVNPPSGYEWSKDYDAVTTREKMQNNPSVRQRLGQRGIKPETLRPLLHPSFSLFTFQRSQLFSSTQIPVCLGFLAKNNHDGKRRDRRRQTLFIGASKPGTLIDRVQSGFSNN